jgi:NADH:ubiquinone oxidoreductase subunit D
MQPVVFTDGDAFARYKVRLGEMRLAIALIRECIDKLPGGSVRARLGHVWKCPKGEAYYTVEGAKGEVGFYMISDGRQPEPVPREDAWRVVRESANTSVASQRQTRCRHGRDPRLDRVCLRASAR